MKQFYKYTHDVNDECMVKVLNLTKKNQSVYFNYNRPLGQETEETPVNIHIKNIPRQHTKQQIIIENGYISIAYCISLLSNMFCQSYSLSL